MMERSLSQVLFQFLPGNTFDYSNQRGIWRVTRLKTDDISGKIDTTYVANRVLARANNWEGGSEGFPGHREAFYFGTPEEVKAEPFPTVYECGVCGHVHHYWDADDLSSENSSLECERNCPGDLEQIQFVSVHSCGEIKGLASWSCPSHGRSHIVLNRRGSQKVSNFRWECEQDNCRESIQVSHLQSCGCSYQPPSASPDNEDDMYTTVHRAGSVYYPHYFTKINLHSSNMGYLQQSDRGVDRAFARLARMVEADSIGSIDLSANVGGEEIDEDRIVEVFSENPEMSLEDAENYLREAGEIDSVTASNRIRELIHDRDLLEAASDDLIQYTLGADDLTTFDVDELANEAQRRGFSEKSDRIRTYHDDLAEAGIRGARVVEDFPVQTFVYGYTRSGREEDEAQIQAFSQSASDGSGTPVFVNTSTTEAIQLDLQPRAVALWLSANIDELSDDSEVAGPVSLPEVNPRDLDSLEFARRQLGDMSDAEIWAFFINHLPDIDRFGLFETETEDTIEGDVTEYVFRLLHTFSHIVLKQASTISGFDRTNLGEYLYPRTLSIAVYSNNRDEFNIGGMRTMVEQDLDHLLTQAQTHGNECVYDPVCSERGGACLSCLHVSEISCSYFNQVLSRDDLFGSRRNTERDTVGFWELKHGN
jgi:hypothetical protein